MIVSSMPGIILVYRKPNTTSNSIEFLFHNIHDVMKNEIEIKEVVLPRLSQGFVNRVYNTLFLLRYRNSAVHVTGDVHYALLGALFSKRILTIHDLSFLTRAKGIRRRVLKLFWVYLPVRLAHRVTVVSTATKDALLKEINIDPSKVHVIHNFIHPVYQPVERTFNATCPRILQVGTDFNKNIENLVRALEGIQCQLVIIGKLSDEQKKLLEDCRFNYFRKSALTLEEIHEEYLKADMLSFVSTVEGFGLPVLEAQATGLPVLTSNCSSLPEVAGDGALMVNPFSVEDIRRGIIEMTTNCCRRKQIVEAGLENAKKFEKKKIAEAYLRIYREQLSIA
jgi:glycosyltransferase involved in cell wall biosynthesis